MSATPRFWVTDVATPLGAALRAALQARGWQVDGWQSPWSCSATDMARDLQGVTHLIHNASWEDNAGADPKLAQQRNVDFPAQLAAVATQSGCRGILHVSSIAAVGPRRDALIATTATPDTTQAWLYGRTRALGEAALAASSGPTLTVRAGLAYGVGLRSWDIAYLELLIKQSPTLWGDGSGLAPLIAAPNWVAGMVTLVEAWLAGATGRFHLVDTPAISWSDHIHTLATWVDKRPRRLRRGAQQLLRWLQQPGPVADELWTFYTRHAHFDMRPTLALGYQPAITHAAQMAQLRDHCRELGYLPKEPVG